MVGDSATSSYRNAYRLGPNGAMLTLRSCASLRSL
jgi:hypothetical protein